MAVVAVQLVGQLAQVVQLPRVLAVAALALVLVLVLVLPLPLALQQILEVAQELLALIRLPLPLPVRLHPQPLLDLWYPGWLLQPLRNPQC